MNLPDHLKMSPGMANGIGSGDRLAELRHEMTLATEDFVAALNRRGAVALAIAEEKRRRGIVQIRDLEREQAVLDHAESVNPGPFSGESVRRVVQIAMDVSSELQAQVTDIPIGSPLSQADPS
jgi:chorismate mutase